MKKFLVVLLIAVMAVSSVFAALTGSVVTTAKYNLYPTDDKKLDGTKVPVGVKTDNNFDIHTVATVEGAYTVPFNTLFAGGADAGKTDNASKGFPYADVAVSLTVKATSAAKAGAWKFDDSVIDVSDEDHETETTNEAIDLVYSGWKKEDKTLTFKHLDEALTATLKLDKAQIVGEEWVLDFLKGPAVPNFVTKQFADDVIFATAFYPCICELCEDEVGYKFDSVGKIYKAGTDSNSGIPYPASIERNLESAEGFTFTWNKYGSIAVAANANEKEAKSYYLISLTGVDYEITDELKAQAAVSFDKYKALDLKTNMSAKLSYTNATEGKLSANAAVDAVLDNEAKKEAGIEATADFAYDNNFLTGEFYYASRPKYFPWIWDKKNNTHKYAPFVISAEADRFSWFKLDVDGTAKLPKFTPVLTVEGVAFDGQKLVADWELSASYIENELSYVDAVIGMTDTLKNNKSQTLYGSVATTVTNYADLEGFGKLTAKIGAEDFLDIDAAKFAEADYFNKTSKTPVKTAKESGFYFNVAAEDFIVDGVDFIFSAADLCKEKAQVFAFDAAYDDADKIKATAGFATGLENSVFEGNHTWIYGDVNVKINEELSAYTGAYAMTDREAHYYVGGKYVNDFTAEARLDIGVANGKDRADIGLYAKVSSEKLVKGATLALQYGALDTKTSQVKKNNLSEKIYNDAITATCTIEF